MGHLPNNHTWGNASEPLNATQSLCDYGVTPVLIGLGFGFGTALGLGLRGPDLGLGLDNLFVSNKYVIK